jgi:dephospho-CoA kinase
MKEGRILRIIGVTGGIGSGKSTVSKILSEFGAYIIDADVIAREVVRKGENALVELKDNFGDEIIFENGELNRKRLAEVAFSDKEKLKLLNNITHKYVTKRIEEEIAQARSRGLSLVVLDVPIPIKEGFLDVVDEVWVVSADMEIKISRVIERSGYTYNETVNRISSQMKDEDYCRVAHRIIINNDGLTELREIVEKNLHIL